MPTRLFRRLAATLPLVPLLLVSALAQEPTPAPAPHPAPAGGVPLPGQMPYFDVVPDPAEGVNRCTWAFNEALFRGVLYPVSCGYTFLLPKMVREKIQNAGHNLTYPVRLVNNSLQGKWRGAWEESKRFGVNSTVGLAGLFDPATTWQIGRSDEDFGQTLGHYGSGPGFYLMLPLIGPSNGRDTVGKIIDYPLDILFWVGQNNPEAGWPSLVGPGLEFNKLSGRARAYKHELDSQNDPYLFLRTLYSLDRQREVLDFMPPTDGEFDADPTVEVVLFKAKTPRFDRLAVTRTVRVPATGRELPYSCWMQKGPAPLAIYIPGLGSHRLDGSSLAYADLLWRNGYSVAVFSNPFHVEFMERASSMPVPGYGPADGDDVAAVLRLIRADLAAWHPAPIQSTLLTGVSHGGYFTLLMAGREARGEAGGPGFDRYVAVNPPPALATALRQLDNLFNAPLHWPAAERRQRMEESVYSALYLARNGLRIPEGKIPLTRDQSEFLIGLFFRYTLLNAIQNSQERHNLGVLTSDPTAFVRRDLYREIRQIGYAEYMERFVVPYLLASRQVPDPAAAVAATDLRRYTAEFQANPKARVQICSNDFLLTPEDLAWFRQTFAGRLAEHPNGGHLGNLHREEVQAALARLFRE